MNKHDQEITDAYANSPVVKNGGYSKKLLEKLVPDLEFKEGSSGASDFEEKVLELLEEILERMPPKKEYGVMVPCGKPVKTAAGDLGCVRLLGHNGPCGILG